jgi:hypothetical protein
MAWGSSKKAITDIRAIAIKHRLRHRKDVPKELAQLTFGRAQLTLSVGRTQTLALADPELSAAERQELVGIIGRHAMGLIAQFVDENSSEFAFTPKLVKILADEARTSLASKIGAGTADLVMEALGSIGAPTPGKWVYPPTSAPNLARRYQTLSTIQANALGLKRAA